MLPLWWGSLQLRWRVALRLVPWRILGNPLGLVLRLLLQGWMPLRWPRIALQGPLWVRWGIPLGWNPLILTRRIALL